MKTIKDYEIIGHGINSPDYFQGCGTYGTDYTDVYTGCGDSEYGALDDALEQAAMSGWDVDGIENTGSKDSIALILGSETPDDFMDQYYYVSIRLK